MMRKDITFPGGPTVKADTTKRGLLAVHRTLTGGKGYVITHLPTHRVVMHVNLQRDAKAVQKELEAIDWDDFELVRQRVLQLRLQLSAS